MTEIHPIETALNAPPIDQTGRAYAWYVVMFLHAAYALSFIDRFVISLLVPSIKRSLVLSDTQMGLLMGPAFAICYILAGLALGVLVDRGNRRLLVAAAILIWSLATIYCGLARSFTALFAARVVVGIGEAAIAPAALSLIGDYFTPARRAFAVSIFAFGVSVGASAAFMLGGVLLRGFQNSGIAEIPGFGPTEPWRLVFLTVGAPGILLAALAFTIGEPLRKDGTRKHPVSAVLGFVRRRWRLLATHFGGFAIFSVISVALGAWVPTYLMRSYGMSVVAVGSLFGLLTLTSGFAGSLLGGFTAGWLQHHGRPDGTMLTVFLGIAASLAPSVLAPLMPTATLSLALFTVAFFAISFASGPSLAAIQAVTPGHFRGQISALYYLTINITGLTLGPVIVPLISDRLLGGNGMIGAALSLTSALVIITGGTLIFFALRFFRPVA